MAEVIGAASGLVGLATFAGQCSVTLYEIVSSFRSHQQRVQDLANETNALADVLGSLADTARGNPELQIPALMTPLNRCARACQEFGQEIETFSSRSGGNRASFRDWARLRYMGEDVDGFRRLLSSYKMTVMVALTDINIRQSLITAEAIEGYNDLLNTAKADLESRLDMIDDKLSNAIHQNLPSSESRAEEVVEIKEERRSTEYCLQICSQLTEHIAGIEIANVSRSTRSGVGSNVDQTSTSEQITNDGLQDCKNTLQRMAVELASHEKKLFDRLIERADATGSSAADITRLKDEWESARHSLDLLSSASAQLEKSVSVIENHATGDAIQFMVSTKGKVLHGTNRGLGWRTRQVGGYLDDDTVKQISRDMSGVTFRDGEAAVQTQQDKGTDGRLDHAQFKERYGEGFKLNPNPT